MNQPIEIRPDEFITYAWENIPEETKAGIVEGQVQAMVVRGRKYHFLSDNEWLDMESGEVVMFRNQGIYL